MTEKKIRTCPLKVYMRQKATEAEILNVIRKSDDPVVTTSEVAEGVDVTRQAALYRLDNLKERGILEKKEVGASVVFYPKDNKQLLELVANS